MLEVGLIVSRFLHYVAVLALFGGALFPLYTYGTKPPGAQPAQIFATLKRWLLFAVLVGFISLIGWFLFTAGAMADSPSAMANPSLLISIAETMTFGHVWVARLGLIAIAAFLLLRWPSGRSYWLAPIFSGLLLVSLAGTGHAQEPQSWGKAWHVVADGAHLLAAGAWLGALWPLAFTLASSTAPQTEAEQASIASLLWRFSDMGQAAVLILLFSGIVNSWFLIGSLDQFVSTFYGRLLSAKVMLFLVMTMLAAANRFWITPQFARPKRRASETWLRHLRRNVLAEQALGLLVLGIVSLLGTLQSAI